jgi:hypothetical protein
MVSLNFSFLVWEMGFKTVLAGQAWWYTSVIPSTKESEIRRITVRSAQEKLVRCLFNKQAGNGSISRNLSYMGGISRKVTVQAQPI